ncbi:MAG: hypothetical protein RR636_12415 [Clostridium sp.]|uniref:hypothetical protein n=1 Tax=Clostridium sp. TaxID=1506 RepID=UPI00305ACFE1
MVNEEITCFEYITKLDESTISTCLSKLSTIDIVKASMGASPEVNELLRGIFNNIDFDNVRKNIGSVRITEIEEIHGTILDMINLKKQ